MQILLIEDDKTVVDKITFLLESVAGVGISAATNFQEAQKIVNDQEINLIVADYRTTNTREVEVFQASVKDIDCILCMEEVNDATLMNGWKILERVERRMMATKLKGIIEKIAQEKDGEYGKQAFCRIKTSILLETSPLHADIYAKLSETKYLKIFLQGDEFDANDFKKYTETKKIEYMYLHANACSLFIHKYVDKIDALMRSKQPPPSVEQLTQMNMVAYESVQELTNTLGFTKEVQTLAKSHISMTVQYMDKKPNLNKLLTRLKDQKGKYLADHSYMLSYIACGIATHLQWGSEATFFKLSLAAFLHDIAISDEKLAPCNLAEAKGLGLDDKQLAVYKNHPVVAAEMVRKMSEIPPDVDAIIIQHHEQPDGKGFPRNVGAAHISPLSTVFIIAHDMVKNIFFPPPEGFNLTTYLASAGERFPQSSFRKILAAAKKLELPE